MPTYVYRRADGTRFEHQQRITEDALATCPTTGQAVTRVPSAGAGLVFKGSGFYQTDYVRPSSGKDSEPTPSEKKVTESKSAESKSTDAKTEGPKDAAPKATAEASSTPASAPAASSTPSTASAPSTSGT